MNQTTSIAAFVRSPCRNCPFRSPGGPPLPLAPPCNRQRPFFRRRRPARLPALGPRSALTGFLKLRRLLGSLGRVHRLAAQSCLPITSLGSDRPTLHPRSSN